MVSAKKLIKMARKWQRKRISLPINGSDDDSCSISSSIVEKCHFVVYTADQKRSVIPLAYLENEIIRELLSISEEEFGLPSGGSIILPLYTADQKRSVIPLAYLENEIIRELLSISEEEFGLPSGGSIILPCDSVFINYIISLIKKGVAAGDLHKSLLLSIPSCCCSTSSLHQESGTQQILVY
ncbi:hypothetical protein K7X08_021735 [Anisodus acutangulus]|uniref:Small auxin up regulated protein n=1 Tax=Anisodus acutangulus TaxID=402998 RepID=A0A9Q1M5Z5_9SOLA|nr:hypothetical protein K7X08_021735 [Anisodus acutangulus]